MSRPRRRLAVLLVVAGLLLAVLYLARGWVPPAVARWLDVGERPRAAEYAMVLPGDESVRPFVAAALVKAGLARGVLVPRTEMSPAVADGIVPPTHEVTRRVLVGRGVPEGRIVLLEGETGHTHGDAELLATFLDSSPGTRVTVVTSHYHTRRARWAFSLVLGDRLRQVSFVSAPTDGYSADNWWRDRRGFMAVTSEYVKLAYYGFRYGPLPYWAAGCLVAAALVVIYRRRKRAALAAASPQQQAAE